MIRTLGQSRKADLCTLHSSGIRTSVRLKQRENVLHPTFFNDGGIVILVRFEHLEKAPSPISVIDGVMMIPVMLEQLAKAQSLILDTEVGIQISLRLVQF